MYINPVSKGKHL